MTAPPASVGVTGHRAFPVGAQVTEAVDRVLDTLAPATVVSSLAEGADRLVAHRALARPGWSLRVVLPLPPDDYAADFAGAASRGDFAALLERAGAVEELPGGGTRTERYAGAGRHVVDTSDALVALWDGQPAAGQGGTAEIVAYARELGRPLAWIEVANAVRWDGAAAPGPCPITWESWPWTG